MLNFLLSERTEPRSTRSVSLHLANGNRQSSLETNWPGVQQWQSHALLPNSLCNMLCTVAYTEVLSCETVKVYGSDWFISSATVRFFEMGFQDFPVVDFTNISGDWSSEHKRKF